MNEIMTIIMFCIFVGLPALTFIALFIFVAVRMIINMTFGE